MDSRLFAKSTHQGALCRSTFGACILPPAAIGRGFLGLYPSHASHSQATPHQYGSYLLLQRHGHTYSVLQRGCNLATQVAGISPSKTWGWQTPGHSCHR